MTGRVVGPIFGGKGHRNSVDKPLGAYIRKQLDMLLKRMKTTGQKFGKGIKRLPDGTVVEFIANLNGPQPILLASVISGSGEQEQILCYFESGWLVFEDRIEEIEGDEPAVYVGDKVWSTNKILDSSRSFLSEYLDREKGVENHKFLPQYRPELFSGLTRLLVQALTSANRSILELVPSSWLWYLDPDYPGGPGNELRKRLGCIRDPSQNYWLVFVKDSGGIEAVKLNHPKESADDKETQSRLDVCNLQNAELPEQTPVIVVDGGDVDYVDFQDSDYELGPWGWCWRYQKRGELDENICGAVGGHMEKDIVETGTIIFRNAYLSIEFVENEETKEIVPVGTFKFDKEEDQVDLGLIPSIYSIWEIDYTRAKRILRMKAIELGDETEVPIPILAYYSSEGKLNTVDYVYNPADAVYELNETINTPGCGGDPAISIRNIRRIFLHNRLAFNKDFVLPGGSVANAESNEYYTTSTTEFYISGSPTLLYPNKVTVSSGCCNGTINGQFFAWNVPVRRRIVESGTHHWKGGVLWKLVISDIPGCCWIRAIRKPSSQGPVYGEMDTAGGNMTGFTEDLSPPSSTDQLCWTSHPPVRIYNIPWDSIPSWYDPQSPESYLFIINDTHSELLEVGDSLEHDFWKIDPFSLEDELFESEELSIQLAKSGYNNVRESYPMESQFHGNLDPTLIGRLIGAE